MSDTYDLYQCARCGAHSAYRRVIDGVSIPICRSCTRLIRARMRRYRPQCRWWYWCEDLDGWRASQSYRPDGLRLYDAVDIECLRLGGEDWRGAYLAKIDGKSTHTTS